MDKSTFLARQASYYHVHNEPLNIGHKTSIHIPAKREVGTGQLHYPFVKGTDNSFSQKPHSSVWDKIGLRVQLHLKLTK